MLVMVLHVGGGSWDCEVACTSAGPDLLLCEVIVIVVLEAVVMSRRDSGAPTQSKGRPHRYYRALKCIGIATTVIRTPGDPNSSHVSVSLPRQRSGSFSVKGRPWRTRGKLSNCHATSVDIQPSDQQCSNHWTRVPLAYSRFQNLCLPWHIIMDAASLDQKPMLSL